MNKENTIVSFNDASYGEEIKKLDDNLEAYLQLEKSFEKITGSSEIKTIEYLDTFITSLSGFPNVEASVKLLDLEIPYNFIQNNINSVDATKIDLVAKKVLKQATEELKEQFTYRLTDKAEADYVILKKIANLYGKLSNIQVLNTINSIDYSNYNIDIFGLNTISQMRQ
jgi:hypothetical protein